MNKKTLYLIYVFLIAIILNTCVHFFHPSYQFYKQNFENVKKQFIEFKDRVVYELIPSINSVNTNLTQNLFVNFESNIYHKIEKKFPLNSSFSSSTIKEEKKLLVDSSDLTIREILVDDYHYCEVNGKKYVRIYGTNYQVGDQILGEVLISIDPLVSRTLHYNFLSSLVNTKGFKK